MRNNIFVRLSKHIKMFWNNIYKKDEFDSSLNSDFEVMSKMNQEELHDYFSGLVKRRWKAHNRNLEKRN
jgi:hypothetical protein